MLPVADQCMNGILEVTVCNASNLQCTKSAEPFTIPDIIAVHYSRCLTVMTILRHFYIATVRTECQRHVE